jgi:HK97 gp10 family phage protein
MMADGMKATIEGVPALTAAFREVRDHMKRSTAFRMVAAAGSVVRSEAKRQAQAQGLRKTGALINNIAFKRERAVPEGTVQYNVGVRHGRDITKKGEKKLLLKVGKSGRIVRANDPFYFRFHEQGTKKLQARPFLAPALESKRAEAIKAMEDRLQKSLDKAGKR